MRTLIKIIAILSLTLYVGAEIKMSQRSFHSSLTDIGSGSSSKQMCSCMFVMKQSEKFCRQFSKEVLLIDILNRHKVDLENKTITTTIGFFFNKRQAKFMGEKLGCTLI